MNRRLMLNQILVDILKSNNVYFQPPSTVKMKYPCIVYQRNQDDEKRANDELYVKTQGYLITVIDPNPDSEIPDKILKLPLCKFNRHFTADNLNHDVYIVYY